MGTSLFTRLAAVVVLMVLSASALTIALNYAKFRQVLTAQESSLYSFVAADLARTIEGSMNLGLPLSMLATTQRLIDAKRAEDRSIVGVTVFDPRGTVVFDTERFRIGSPVPATMLPTNLPGAASGSSWRIARAATLGVGERISNSFGQSAGGVVVRYDPDRLDSVMLSVLLVMATSGLYVLMAAALIAVVAVWFATRSTRRWFVQSAAQLEASIHAVAEQAGAEQAGAEQAGPEGAGATPPGRADDPPFVVSARRTIGALAAAEHDLIQIGGASERPA